MGFKRFGRLCSELLIGRNNNVLTLEEINIDANKMQIALNDIFVIKLFIVFRIKSG